MIIKKFDFGELTIFENYIIGVMNKGISVNIDTVRFITNIAKEHFNDKPWGYISNRINSYALDPTVHMTAPEFEKNMKAFAAVTHRKETAMTSGLEQDIHEPSYEFSIFTNLDEAIEWVTSTLLNDE